MGDVMTKATEEKPFTAESLKAEPKVAPRGDFTVVQKTVGELFAEYPHSPRDLSQSMADYLNAQFAEGKRCVGSLGDTTNHFFIFTGR